MDSPRFLSQMKQDKKKNKDNCCCSAKSHNTGKFTFSKIKHPLVWPSGGISAKIYFLLGEDIGYWLKILKWSAISKFHSDLGILHRTNAKLKKKKLSSKSILRLLISKWDYSFWSNKLPKLYLIIYSLSQYFQSLLSNNLLNYFLLILWDHLNFWFFLLILNCQELKKFKMIQENNEIIA